MLAVFPTLSASFSRMGFPLVRGCGLRIARVYSLDADDQDYGLVLRLPGFDVNSFILLPSNIHRINTTVWMFALPTRPSF